MAKIFFAVLCWIAIIQQSSSVDPLFDGECEQIQGFEAGKTYTYSYEGSIVTDPAGVGNNNAFKIKCDEVNVFVYARCSARLSLDSCSLLTAEGKVNDFQLSKYSKKFVHKLHRSNLYFHFNGGEVMRVIHHPQEKNFILNIKRSILSHLVIRAQDGAATRSSNSGGVLIGAEWNEVKYSFYTRDLNPSIPTNVQIRIPGVSTTMLNDVFKQGMGWLNTWARDEHPLSPEVESCEIILARDRLVETLTCTETHDLFQSSWSDQKSTIELKLLTTEASTRSLSARERNTMTRTYIDSTIIFTTDVLDQPSSMMNENFNPTKTILKAATGDITKVTPLIGRLESWIVSQDSAELDKTWAEVENMASFNDLTKAKELWNTLLFNCVDQKWCQSADECKKRSACHNTLAGIIQRSYGEEKEDLLVRVSKVQHPSAQLVSSLLHTSNDEKTVNWFIAVEKLVNNHVSSQFVRKNTNMINRAKTDVFRSVQQLCGAESPDVAHLKQLEAAVLSTAGFVASNEEDMKNIFQICWQNPHLDHTEANEVFLSMIKVMGTSNMMQIASERSRMMYVLSDPSYSSKVRLSAFLALVTTNPSNDELSTFIQLAQASDPSLLQSFMDDFMRTQASLINSQKSSLSASALEHLQTAYSTEPLVREDYSYSLPLRLTALDIDLDASFVVISEGTGVLPKIVEVHLEVPQFGMKLIDLELHLGGVQPYLNKLFASDGAFPLDLVEALRKRPMQSWIKSWFEEDPSLSQQIKTRIQSIKHELNFFKMMNELTSTPFLSVKLLGVESNGGFLDQLFNLEAGQIFHLLESVEKGVEIDAINFATPIMARFSTFTSLGLPKVVTGEISATIKSAMSCLVDITNLFFTGFSDNRIALNPRIEISALFEQYVNAYKGVSSGAGELRSITSQFDSKMSVKTTPSSVTVTVVPGTKDILYLMKEEQTGLPWSSENGLEERRDFPECRTRRASLNTYWLSNCVSNNRGNRKQYGVVANRPTVEMILVAEKTEHLDENQEYSYGVDVVAFMQDARTGQQMFQLHPAIIIHPSKNMIQLDIGINSAPTMTLKLGFDHKLDDANLFDEISLSLNVSSFFGDTPLAHGLIKRIDVGDAVYAYNVTVIGIRGPRVTGEVRKQSDSEYSFSLLAHQDGYSLGGISYKSENLQENGKVGKLVSTKVLVQPEEYAFFIRALHTEEFAEYEKVLHFGVNNEYHEYFFLDGRMEKSMQDRTDSNNYNWKAGITTNFLQGQCKVDATPQGHVDIFIDFYDDPQITNTFTNAQRGGSLEQLTMNQVLSESPDRRALSGQITFTEADAHVPTSYSRAYGTVVISQKADCSPCGKVVWMGSSGSTEVEATVDDDGRTITLDISFLHDNNNYNVQVDRAEKSILFTVLHRPTQIPFQIKLAHGTNDGDVQISTIFEDEGYKMTRSYEIIDHQPNVVFVHALGIKTDVKVEKANGNTWATCVKYDRTCDPLAHEVCGDNEDCNSICDAYRTCCTERSSCLSECDDYSDCVEQTSMTWLDNMNRRLGGFYDLFDPQESHYFGDRRFEIYITYIQAKTVYFMLSHIEDVQANAFTSRSEGFGVEEIKAELRSVFENIYFGELWLAAKASDPAEIAEQAYEGLVKLYNSELGWTVLEPHQGAAFITQENGQFVTMNGYYHNIPSIPSSSCSWLASTDTIEGAVNVIMKRDSTIYTIGEESVKITMDGRAFWSPDGETDFQQINFPFFFKVVTCSKPSANVIECKGMYSNARFVYYPNTGVTTIYGDMRGSVKNIQGAMGFPMNTTEIIQIQLPDGTVAANEEQFLNAYELSGDSQCFYNEQNPSIDLSSGDNDVCVAAFAPFLNYVSMGLLSSEKFESYVKACALSATTETETCHYTDMLAFSLRKRGIACPSDPKCLSCGSTAPVRASIDNINIAFVVSLSESSSDIDPVRTIESIMTSIDYKWKGDATYSVITYGGQLFRYEPYLMSFNYRDTAADKATVMSSLENLLFDGPQYDTSSSIEAIKYASQAFHDIHQGTSRFVIVVAPQENQASVGSIASLDTQIMSGTMTKAYLLSHIYNDGTSDSSSALKFFEGTGGNCYYHNQVDDLTTDVTTAMDEVYKSTVECTCQMTDILSGTVTSYCNRVN